MKYFLRTAFYAVMGLAIFTISTSPVAAATAKLIVGITSPTAKTRASNEVFTVTGTTSGGAGATNVFYSLNSSDWTNASQSGSWSNWTAQVTLVPGTNIVSAFAVDNNGAHSATNTVRFIYVVLATLAVHTNGNVTVKPDYNGAQLQIGTVYSMTGKSAVKNFGVKNWTDASNNVVAIGNTLTFLMASNLDFTANFGDVQKPSISLVSVYTNNNGVANQLFIRGKASDNVAVAGVYFKLNSSAWQLAQVTTNNWTNWVVQLDNLLPGTNTFLAYSMDTSSNSSYIIPLQINNNIAITKLGNLWANVQPNDANAFNLVFGSSTFSHKATVEGDVNGVGSYSYAGSGGFGLLKMKYAAPPIAATLSNRVYALTFQTRNTATYSTYDTVATNFPVFVTNGVVITTNLVATNLTIIKSGSMSFHVAPKLAFSSAVNQLVLAINRDGDGNGTFFTASTYTSFPLLTSGTNNGKYTYATYSPYGGLFKLTNTNGTEYVLTAFEGTNFGSYYSEGYNPSGQPIETNNGRFILGSQRPGGNAPATLVNHAFQIFAGDVSCNDVFGNNTFSQDSQTTNFENVVGSYGFSLASTNIGQLNLAVTAPPHLAGNTNATRLIFVASNAGLFTNDDGTISSFVMSSATNFPLTSVAGTTLNILESDTYATDTVNLANDGSFNFGDVPVGEFNYATYSPAGAMLQLSVTNTSFTVTTVTNYSYVTNFDETITTNLLDNTYETNANFKMQNFWLQLNLTSVLGTTNYGNTYVNIYDTNSVLTDYFRGTYNLH
jgi:hypothetical protein